MAGTITFGGIGSGIDTESIVSGLVQAERAGQTGLKTRLTATQSSLSNLSSISSLLAKLKSSADALDTAAEVGSFKASSSQPAIVASANGLALPGSYAISVDKLAKEQRTYSNTFASASTALGSAGTLTLGVGAGTPVGIAVTATDTLDTVIGKINASGLRLTASAFFDGTNYRMQLRGLDTGASNALSITEGGTAFGFGVAANTTQAAQDAQIKVDGFTVTSKTNQVSGAIRGVTLALTAETTTPATVGVENDSQALQTKLRGMVDAYNAVVAKVKDTAGSGSIKAKDTQLAGDSVLRSLTSRIASALQTTVGSGSISSLSAIGLSLDRDGKLALDSTKFDAALQKDAAGVTNVLAGTDVTSGVMDVVAKTVDAFTRPDTGLLVTRTDTFNKRVTAFNQRIDREETRINRYADQLRKQFTNMDAMVSSWNAQSSYLNQL